mgnify:CR=1 FL=1
MKIRTLVFALIGLSTAAGLAAGSPHAGRPATLAEMVAHMESKYPGQVTAIQYDASGAKGPHFHVDMRFAASGLARVDVDAVTRRITSRDASPLPAGSVTLSEAAALIVARVERALTRIDKKRITLNPDCGFAPGSAAKVDTDEVYLKLKAEAEAARLLRARHA